MIPAETSKGSPAKPWQWAAALTLFCAAFAFMIYRGPVRALGPGGSSDFSLIWQSTRAFLDGKNPYNVDAIRQAWAAHSAVTTLPPSEWNSALFVYPPSTYVLMSPWCCSDWLSGRMGWMLTGTAMLIGTLAGCLRLAGLSWREPMYWVAFAAGLAMAPGHTGVSVGQTSIIVMFLIVVAQLLRLNNESGRGLLGLVPGIALGLACAIKPQIGLIFLAYEAGRGRWKSALIGVVVAGLVLAAGVWKLDSSGVDWYPQWQSNLAAFAASDNANPAQANPLRYQLINLSYLLHGFTDNRDLVKWLVYAIIAALCGAYFLADRGGTALQSSASWAQADGTAPGGTALQSSASWANPRDRSDLLTLSFLAAISMLIVYHRMYDAVVLYFPLAWLFAAAKAPVRLAPMWPRALSALCLLAFLAPGASLFMNDKNGLVKTGKIPSWIAESWAFNSLFVPHAVIALVGLAICAILVRAKSNPHSQMTVTD